MSFQHKNVFLAQKILFRCKNGIKTQKLFFCYELFNLKTGSERRRSKVFVLSNDKAVSRCEILNRKNNFWRNEVAKYIAEFIKKCLDNKHYIVISVKNRLEQGARFM